MSTITSGLTPATALSAGARARILVLPDGCAVVLYTNGTDLFLKGSLDKTTWSSPVTVIAGVSSIAATIVAVAVGNAIHVYRASGTTISCTRIPYTGSASFGSPVTATIGTAAVAPLALRAVFDPAGISTDSEHTAGTVGLIHLLLDEGRTWEVWACDPNTAHGTKPKVVLTTSVALPLTAPGGNADLALRTGGSATKLYALASGSSSDGWAGCEIAYDATAATGLGAVSLARKPGAFEDTIQQFPTYWVYGDLPASFPSYAVSAIQASKFIDSPGGTWGWQVPFTGGQTYSGTWQADLDLKWNLSGISGQAHIAVRIYQVSGSSRTLRGSLTGTATAFPGGSSYVHLSVSGSIASFSTGPSDFVYAEIGLTPDTLLTIHSSTAQAWSGVTVENVVLTFPSTTPLPATYTPGSVERPLLPSVASGASLVPDGAAGVDILLNDAGTLRSCNRNSLGAYQNVLPVTSPLVAGILVDGSLGTGAGNEAALFYESNHIWGIPRSSGAWGTPAQVDTAVGVVEQAFAGVDVAGLTLVGKAVAYLVGSGPYDLIYEDGGFSSGATAPTTPLVSLVPHDGTTDAATASGGSPVASTTSLVPLIQSLYQNSNATVPLGAIAYGVHDDTASATVWTSGQVPVSTGPLPGQSITQAYGSVGAAATALVVGHQYTLTVTHYEASTGLASGGGTLTFGVYAPVTITGLAPDTFTTVTDTVDFTPNQADSGVTLDLYRYVLARPDGTVQLDTGIVALSMTSGTPASISVSLAGKVNDGVGYTQSLTVYATPPSSQPLISGAVTGPITVAIPTCDVPVIDSAAWDLGSDPFTGGTVDVVYHEPSGSIPAVTITVYTSINGGSFTLVGTRPAPSGSDTAQITTLGNQQTVIVGLSATSADGIESGMALTDPITAVYTEGIWVIQQSDPTIKVQIGRVQKDSGDLGWDPKDSADDAELFDRDAPVTSTGTIWYRTSNELTYLFPRAYAEQMSLQFEQWNREGTTVIVQDPDGLSHICRVLTARRTHIGTTKIRGMSISFKEVFNWTP